MKISPYLYKELLQHAVTEAPFECCGAILVRGDVAVEVIEMTNILHSIERYAMDTQAQHDTYEIAADRGLRVGAFYHSHTRGGVTMSTADIRAFKTRTELCIIVSVGHGNQAEVKAYLVLGGVPMPAELQIAN
jgi:proteasome lid subunit RPN8/RPN11